MAALPSYVHVRMSVYEEVFDPAVERIEMERGPPKQAVRNSQVLMTLQVAFLFMTTAQHDAFFDWYMNDIRRIGQFTMTHPRTGETITAQFPGGDIGSLRSLSGTDHMWQRELAVEYLR